MKPTPRLVSLPEHGTFWFQDYGGEGPLAPLDHCRENGQLIPQFPIPLSYAHVYSDGSIIRYGRTIGNLRDIQVQP